MSLFQTENGNSFTLLIIFIVNSLQKGKRAQIYYYDPQSAGINVQYSQSESVPWRLDFNHNTWNIIGSPNGKFIQGN